MRCLPLATSLFLLALLLSPAASAQMRLRAGNVVTVQATDSATTGDWNGDGALDAVLGGYPNVLLGDGEGNFVVAAVPPTHPGAGGPSIVASGDFDLDGDEDVAVGYVGLLYPEDSVGILLGDGTGSFTLGALLELEQTFPASRSPVDIEEVDVDGDGDLDLAVLSRDPFSSGQSMLRVLGNDGAGGFAILDEVTLATYSGYAIASGDWNANGAPDLAVAFGGEVQVLLGVGDGTFAALASMPAAGVDLHADTVDADGIPDLVLVGSGLRFLPGVGDGTFGPAVESGVPGVDLVLGDWDGDGRVDAATAYLDRVEVFAGDGAGLFASTASLAVSGSLVLLSARVDGGSGLDLLAIGEGVTTTLRDDPAQPGSFLGAPSRSVPGFCNATATGDFDGDGRLDVVVTKGDSPAGASVQLGDGAGGFVGAGEVASGTYPVSVLCADFDGDGHDDVAVGAFQGRDVSVHLGDGAGGFTALPPFPAGNYPGGLAAADFDEDGRLDLVAAQFQDDAMGLYLGDGEGRFTAAGTFAAGDRPIGTAAGDWNDDGHADVALARWGEYSVQILLGDGAGGFATGTTVMTGSFPWELTARDLDGDGHEDLAVAYAGSFGQGGVTVALGDGVGGFPAPANFPSGSFTARAVVAADLDLDGRLDLAVAHESGVLSVLRGLGGGAFGAPVLHAAGDGARTLVAGDFDLDQDPDVVVVNRDAETLVFLRNDHQRRVLRRQRFGPLK